MKNMGLSALTYFWDKIAGAISTKSTELISLINERAASWTSLPNITYTLRNTGGEALRVDENEMLQIPVMTPISAIAQDYQLTLSYPAGIKNIDFTALLQEHYKADTPTYVVFARDSSGTDARVGAASSVTFADDASYSEVSITDPLTDATYWIKTMFDKQTGELKAYTKTDTPIGDSPFLILVVQLPVTPIYITQGNVFEIAVDIGAYLSKYNRFRMNLGFTAVLYEGYDSDGILQQVTSSFYREFEVAANPRFDSFSLESIDAAVGDSAELLVNWRVFIENDKLRLVLYPYYGSVYIDAFKTTIHNLTLEAK